MKDNVCYCDYNKYQLINIIQYSKNQSLIKDYYEPKIKKLKVTIDYLEKKEKNNESTIEQLKKNNEKLSIENKRLEAMPEWKKLYELKDENQNLIEKHSKELENIKKEFENKFVNIESEKIELEKKGENNEKQYQKKIEQLNQTNNQLIGKIKNDYEKEIKTLNSMNEKKLNESKQKHKEEIMSIKKNNQIELNKLNIETERLKEEKQKEKKNYEENINNLKKNQIEEQQKLENKYNEKILQINEENLKLKNEGEILANVDPGNLRILSKYGLIKNISSNSNALEIDSENRIKVNSQMPTKVVFEEFYDLIVNIKSVKDIDKGWELKMNQKGKENYNKFKKEPVIKIGVIGNSNKGKSFILSKLSKINLPSGASIRTEGLSIKYPEIKDNPNRKIVLLDSAGLETPVLNEDEKDEKDLFKEKSRDKLITELFLQNYIINNSDILIIVVGILTYSEQKLLNKIKNELKMMEKNDHFIEKERPNTSLFVIHNLITYKTVKQVEDYIDEFLLKSATLNLEKAPFSKTIKSGIHYTEKFGQKTIYHLIYAHEGSEAGEHYNKYTLDFIESYFKTVSNLKPYDVIETIKDNFIELSNDILEKTEKPITKESFDKSNNNIIKLSEVKDIVLKKCLIDELGFSNLKANSFEPTFNYYKTDDGKILKIRIEAPGNCELNTKRYPEDKFNVIIIKGNKLKDKMTEEEEKIQKSNREYGEFKLDIRLEFDYFKFKAKKPKIEQIDGVFRLEYEAEDEEEEGSFKPKEIK
jgi:hypothetical protein